VIIEYKVVIVVVFDMDIIVDIIGEAIVIIVVGVIIVVVVVVVIVVVVIVSYRHNLFIRGGSGIRRHWAINFRT